MAVAFLVQTINWSIAFIRLEWSKRELAKARKQIADLQKMNIPLLDITTTPTSKDDCAAYVV